jgi:hypothetical protein
MSRLSLKRETLCILDASNVQGGFVVITVQTTCACQLQPTQLCKPSNVCFTTAVLTQATIPVLTKQTLY